GVLGRLGGASASYVHAGGLNGSLAGPRAWMQDPRRAGVGGLGDLGIHLVDAFAALAQVPVLHAISLDRGEPGRTDLGGTAVGRWGDTPLALRTSWVSRPAGLELTVIGSAGTAVLREGALELIDDDGSVQRWIGAPPDAGEALRSFAVGLRARRLDMDGLSGAIRAQEVLERAATAS
ncbi:MAG: hypothetical protein M3016_10680, partial [Actinomycetota bacterium]|nr:hypothetical protein [Actinomycetota bacterium]